MLALRHCFEFVVLLTVAAAVSAAELPPGSVERGCLPNHIGAGSAAAGPLVVARDSLGRWLVAGLFSSFDGAATGDLVRLMPDGSLDPGVYRGVSRISVGGLNPPQPTDFEVPLSGSLDVVFADGFE